LIIGSLRYPSLETTKPLVAARQTADATVSAEKTSQIPTTLGPQLEDPRRVVIARVAPAVVAAVLEVVAVAVAAAAEVHLTVPVEELVAAAIAEAEAMRTATPPAMHVATTTLATGLMRSSIKRLLKEATTIDSRLLCKTSQPAPS
jgi:hypothetical protein